MTQRLATPPARRSVHRFRRIAAVPLAVGLVLVLGGCSPTDYSTGSTEAGGCYFEAHGRTGPGTITYSGSYYACDSPPVDRRITAWLENDTGNINFRRLSFRSSSLTQRSSNATGTTSPFFCDPSRTYRLVAEFEYDGVEVYDSVGGIVCYNPARIADQLGVAG